MFINKINDNRNLLHARRLLLDLLTKGLKREITLIDHTKIVTSTSLIWDLVNLIFKIPTLVRSHKNCERYIKVTNSW